MKRNYPCAVCGKEEVIIYLDPVSLSGRVVECPNCHAELIIDLSEAGGVTLWPVKGRGSRQTVGPWG
jgi:DNA-directed RNA polymerase subunit RPC12/RpoP